MNTYEALYESGKQRAKFTAWILSDGHCSSMEEQTHNLDVVLKDYESLGKPADMIWYLGDAVWTHPTMDTGDVVKRGDHLYRELDKLGIPLCFATGNHDYDYAYIHRVSPDNKLPFYEKVRQHEGWYTTKKTEDTWFKVKIRNTMVYFFCDHMASDGSWVAASNRVTMGADLYPYGPSHFDEIRHDMETCGAKHIITASHYGFPGGNEGDGLLSLLQPLPRNVRLHLYGHCHVGSYNEGERIFSQIQWVDWQDVPQVDIASVGGAYGDNFRSAFLQMYEDDSLGLFFRNHSTGRFYAAFFPADTTTETEKGYADRAKKIDPAAVLPAGCPGMISENKKQ